MANMAIDKWFPKKFASLSDRLVTMNGVILMGFSAILLMALFRGSVQLLVVLYSINVFITFSISQLGMVKHWWTERGKLNHWKRKLSVNGIGFVLTSLYPYIGNHHQIRRRRLDHAGYYRIIYTCSYQHKKHYFKTAVRLQKVRQQALSELHDKPGPFAIP